MLLLIDGGNDVDNYMKLSLAAEGIDPEGTVDEQREARQNYINEHAFHFIKTKDGLNLQETIFGPVNWGRFEKKFNEIEPFKRNF